MDKKPVGWRSTKAPPSMSSSVPLRGSSMAWSPKKGNLLQLLSEGRGFDIARPKKRLLRAGCDCNNQRGLATAPAHAIVN
jgi:hypothetical protein